MGTKPCIECGQECEILPIQLGDSFTITFLRLCGPECLFLTTYDYLYEIGYHKDFRNNLYDKQNEEDSDKRKAYIDDSTKEYLEAMRKSFEANPGLLTTPVPQSIHSLFATAPVIPTCSEKYVRWVKPSKQERISWQTDYVNSLKAKLLESLQDLEKVQNE